MGNRILIAYATKAGSTAEIAEVVAEELRKAGADVDVKNVKAVRDVDSYDAVVIGSGTRMFHLYKAARRFANKHRKALQQKKTAYFTVGLTMQEDTPENRQKAASYLEPLREVKEPVSLGLFAGVMDYSKLDPPFKWILPMAANKQDDGKNENEMQEGDFRNWKAIRTWAQELADTLINK